jgi:probable F420-dependent oxidoreductase
MKLDTQLGHRGLSAADDEARSYERMGFDGAWTFEAGHDPFLPVALAAQATERLALGTNIAVAFARSPMSMAQAAWDLQKLSGGRFHLGLGTQVRAHVERRYSMPYDPPVARLVDYVRCLQAIWQNFQTGAKPSYEGRFYRFTLMNPMFSGGPSDYPRIPIWIAGVNPLVCRAAGEVADGFHVHPLHSVSYLRELVIPAIEEGAKRAGRRRAEIQLYSPVFAATGETPAEWDRSVEEIRRQISFYGSTPTYRPVLEHLGHGDLARRLSELARRGEWKEMAKLVPDELVGAIGMIEKSSALPNAIRERYAEILDRVSLYFPIRAEDSDAAWQAFTKAFREKAAVAP